MKELILTLSICHFAMAQVAVNAASGGPAVSPGSIIAIYGSFPLSTGQALTLPLPTHIAGTGVTGDLYFTEATTTPFVPMPLFYWSPSQVNALLPSSTKLTVKEFALIGTQKALSSGSLDVQAQAPGIFINPAQECSIGVAGCSLKETRGIITDAAGKLISGSNPARPGQGLVIWSTGVSSINTAPAVQVTSALGSILQASVFYSGATAEQGLDQVNFYVPNSIDIGTCAAGLKFDLLMNMKSTVSGVESNIVALPVLTAGC